VTAVIPATGASNASPLPAIPAAYVSTLGDFVVFFFLLKILAANGSDNRRRRRALLVQSYSPGGAHMHPHNTCFLGPTQVFLPNGISIGAAVFAVLTVVTNTQTDHAMSERVQQASVSTRLRYSTVR